MVGKRVPEMFPQTSAQPRIERVWTWSQRCDPEQESSLSLSHVTYESSPQVTSEVLRESWEVTVSRAKQTLVCKGHVMLLLLLFSHELR